MTQNENDHNEQKDGGVVLVLVAALAAVDGSEHSDVENDEQQHWHQAQHKQPDTHNGL